MLTQLLCMWNLTHARCAPFCKQGQGSPGCECAGSCGVRMDFSPPGTCTLEEVASGTLL